MIKKLILLTTALFSIIHINAQNGRITGHVATKQGNAIINANVTLTNTNNGTVTNDLGDFKIENIKSGSYTLKVSYIGYLPKEVSVTVTNNQTTQVPSIVLSESEEQLNEILVEATKDNKYSERTPSSSLRLKGELVKLPQNIQIISNELLADQQVTNMMDGVIRNVSGVTMLEHWGHFARVNMRGFRLPAFRNGVNLQDTWGPLSEDMNTVERIEFVKGPAGFMMSAGEPGGFYNVVTKKPTENFIANASMTAGSFDFYRGTIDIGGKLTEDGKLLGRFNGMYQTADSHRGNEDAKRYGLAPSFTYNLSNKTSITTELNLQQAESFIGSAYVFAPAADGYGSLDRNFKFTDTNYPKTDIQEVTIFTNIKHAFSKNWSVEGQLAYLRYDQVGNSTWLTSMESNGDAYRYISGWDALSLGKFAQVYLYGYFNTGGIAHNIMGGFDFSDKKYWADWSQFFAVDTSTPFNIYNPTYGNTSSPNFDRSIPVQYRNGGQPYNANSVRAYYVQDEMALFKNKARLTLAGRYTDLHTLGKTESDRVFTPRIGLSVNLIPTLNAYALFDQSFLPQSGISASGGLLNDPVKGEDIEGGIKGNFFNGRLKTSIGVYKINKNKILVGDPDYPSQNFSIYSGEIESKGIEFDAQGQIAPNFNIILNYANTNVKDKSGSLVAGHSKHVTNGWFNYTFPQVSVLNGFGASVGYQYQVDRSTWAWAANDQSDLPDYFRLDGALSWQNHKMRVQLNVNNILDEYLYAGANYGSYLYWQSEPGINGRITVTYNF